MIVTPEGEFIRRGRNNGLPFSPDGKDAEKNAEDAFDDLAPGCKVYLLEVYADGSAKHSDYTRKGYSYSYSTELLERAIELYIRSDNFPCLFCGSENTISERLGRTDLRKTYELVCCNGCGQRWEKEYTLSDVATVPQQCGACKKGLKHGDRVTFNIQDGEIVHTECSKPGRK